MVLGLLSLQMNTAIACILLFAGLVILWKSADLLVAGAVSLAKRLGVSPLVIGLTVVAMGTSAPEVSASLAATIKGLGDIAIGNVYGSNIANLALIGGICAIIRPMNISRRLLSREIVVMLGSAILLWPIISDRKLSRFEGIVLLAVFAALIILMIHAARKESARSAAINESKNQPYKIDTKEMKFIVSCLFILLGLAGLAFGAKITVDGAVFIGRKVGLSEAVIAQTIIAIGTSLPELVTCVVAVMKGHEDISIGNLVGSNIFNTLLVTGAAGSVREFTLSARLTGVDYWIMIAVSVSFVLIALVGKKAISRNGGFVLLAGYIGYLIYLLGFGG